VRFLLRFLSLLFLVAAVMVGIIDSIQSVAGENIYLTPFGAALFTLNPNIVASAQAFLESRFPPFVWNTAIAWILTQPAFLIFLILSFLCWVVAYKRQPAAGRFAART
jgi:hypothetical protein